MSHRQRLVGITAGLLVFLGGHAPAASSQDASQEFILTQVGVVDELLGDPPADEWVAQVVRRPGNRHQNSIFLTEATTPRDLYRALITLANSHLTLGPEVDHPLLIPIHRRKGGALPSGPLMQEVQQAMQALHRGRGVVDLEEYGTVRGVHFRMTPARWVRSPTP